MVRIWSGSQAPWRPLTIFYLDDATMTGPDGPAKLQIRAVILSAKMIRDYEVTTRIEPDQSKTTRSRVLFASVKSRNNDDLIANAAQLYLRRRRGCRCHLWPRRILEQDALPALPVARLGYCADCPEYQKGRLPQSAPQNRQHRRRRPRSALHPPYCAAHHQPANWSPKISRMPRSSSCTARPLSRPNGCSGPAGCSGSKPRTTSRAASNVARISSFI